VSEPEALIGWFGSLGLRLARSGLAGGRVAMALCGHEAGWPWRVELLETRHVSDAFKAMPVKSDRNEARKIAQLMRLGWFRPVHCKSIAAQEIRALLTARKLLQSKLLDLENSLRGILRGFGLKVGKTTRTNFAGRHRRAGEGHPTFRRSGRPLTSGAGRSACRVHGLRSACGRCRAFMTARLLMSTPASGRSSRSPLPARSMIPPGSPHRSRRGRISG